MRALFSYIPSYLLLLLVQIVFFIGFPQHMYLSPQAAYATDTDTAIRKERALLKKKISASQITIQQLQIGLENEREGIEKSQKKQNSILTEIEELDRELIQMREKLSTLAGRIAEQQTIIATLEKQLLSMKEQKNRAQAHVEIRTSAYYKLGKIDLLNITFSTQTLPELMRFHDAFQEVIDYDKETINSYRLIIDEMENTKESLGLEKELLEEFHRKVQEKEQGITLVRNNKQHLLDRVKNQEALHQQAAKEIEDATQALSHQLLAMKEKEKRYSQGFLLNKKEHIPPIAGTVVTLFKQEKINQFGIKRKNPGITIEGPDGSKVRAIYDGKVIFAGYLKGYGNTVIIDHGHNYYTVTARIEKLLTRKNTRVRKYDIIGITGSTATILDSGLYFEIRKKNIALDPLEWLNKKHIQLAENLKTRSG